MPLAGALVRRRERPGRRGREAREGPGDVPASRLSRNRAEGPLPLGGPVVRERLSRTGWPRGYDALIARGLKRTPLPRFLSWLLPWVGVLAFGLYAVYRCFAYGLNQTNMDNRFAFGLWILYLTVIALGAELLFTGSSSTS